MPKPTEIATLTVNGMDYTDWESVSVTLVLRGTPPQSCRFTCNESSALVKNWLQQQIMPGAKCTVTLAGQLAFNGTVISRQVFADARRHRVEIQCANNLELATASVISKTGEFRNSTPEQIIRSVLQGVGKKLTILGGSLPNINIPRYSVTPGESIIDFIDTLTRQLGTMGSSTSISHYATPQGDFAIVVGNYGNTDEVVEGRNMLEGREVIYIPLAFAEGGAPTSGNGGSDKPTSQAAIGQSPGNDQKWGAAVASVPFLSQAFQMMGMRIVPSVVIPEIPLWSNKLLDGRSASEKNWLNEDYVTVYGTTQGWLTGHNVLWVPGQTVLVTSPMLVMNGTKLTLKSATFSQDNQQGTRTILEMCNPNALDGQVPKTGQ